MNIQKSNLNFMSNKNIENIEYLCENNILFKFRNSKKLFQARTHSFEFRSSINAVDDTTWDRGLFGYDTGRFCCIDSYEY